ncbi:tRNA-specific adenosine deaminase subunit tad3 [Orbilia brochopaga]|uniref:tRNA-specific adenosine deaminase subunit tad3 n=1 Tax=Orbilia brochopaga TaxID=3140254 RepID=A0AAV9U030_9PEZI
MAAPNSLGNPAQAEVAQNNSNDSHDGFQTVSYRSRGPSYDQNRRNSYQGGHNSYNNNDYNSGRPHSTNRYNDNNYRDRSSSNGRQNNGYNNRGNWNNNGNGGRWNNNNNGRWNNSRGGRRGQGFNRSSSGGSPYPSGNSSSGGSRANSRGPLDARQTEYHYTNPGGQYHGTGNASPGGSQGSPGIRHNPPAIPHTTPQVERSSPITQQTPQLPSPTTTPSAADGQHTAVTNKPAEGVPAVTPTSEQPVVHARPQLPPIDTSVSQNKSPESGEADGTTKKKRRRNRKRKNAKSKEVDDDANGEDADNEGASGSEEVSASPVAIKFGADLVTASIVVPQTTITMIPVPGQPAAEPKDEVGVAVEGEPLVEGELTIEGEPTVEGEPTIDQEDGDEPKANDAGDKEPNRLLEENRRKDSRFKVLPTRRELTAAIEQMEVYTVVVHSRAANEVVNLIKKITDNLKEGVPDCQHLRRLVKPENLPPSLTGLPESMFVDYSTENQSPTTKVNPDGTVENVSRSRGASRAQRRRRNASYRKGEKPLYVMLCPVVAMTIRELYEALSTHPLFAGVDLDCEIPFDAQDIPQIIKHTVPQWAPCNLKQSNHWTEKYWPTIYRRTNPYGPHPFLKNKWEDRLHAPYPIEQMDHIPYDGNQLTMGEYYMRLARKVAEEGESKGAGLRIGCVVVELKGSGPQYGRVVCVAHDARVQSENPLTHACYRAISLVGRKRVEVTARHKPKINIHAVNGPNSTLEEEFYAKVPGDPDGYLMNDLVVFMTHEPCVMCSMAMVHSRIGCFVFGEPMVSGGLHADLAPPDGHRLPVRGVTEEDVAAYRERHNITEADLRQRPTADEGLFGGGENGDPNAEFQAKVKLPPVRGKGKNSEANLAKKEQFLKETAARLKKESGPVDPALKTDEAVIDYIKDKAMSKMIRTRDVAHFKDFRATLIAERERQLAEAETQAKIAARQETQRKEHKIDKATQTAKIFDSIKDGEDQLGAVSNVNMGSSSSNQGGEQTSIYRQHEYFRAFSKSPKPEGRGHEDDQDGESSVHRPEDNDKFAQTCSVYDPCAKNVLEKGAVPVNMGLKVPEDEDQEDSNMSTLIKSERKGDSSMTKFDSSRDNSPASPDSATFGGLGRIDILGVNEDRDLDTKTVTAAVVVKQEEGDTKQDMVGEIQSTTAAERGRSRVPAPFKPGTGEYVPTNIGHGSPPRPSETSPENDCTTSGGETGGGTGAEEESDLDAGAAFDLTTMEAPDTGDGDGKSPVDGDKTKKKKKKRRARGKKKAQAAAAAEDNTASAKTEEFQIVDASEAKNDSVSVMAEASNNSTTHGSSTTAPSAPSSHEQNTGTTAAVGSRPGTPDTGEDANEADDNEEAAEEEGPPEPDELVHPTRPYRVLAEKISTGGFPKYDHGPGDGYGLFWREKLNWKFLCFRYSKPDYEADWDAQLEWQGRKNDRISA